MMDKKKCHKCNRESVWEDYTNKEYCENHFLELIEKRIRKNLRINKLIDLKKEYYLQENEENKQEITKFFLKKIFVDRIKLTNKENNVINSNTLDDEAQELLDYFMKKQELTKKIKPLSVITDEEIVVLAKILKISLNIKPKNHSELTKKDPQILFSMHKSKEFIENRLNSQK